MAEKPKVADYEQPAYTSKYQNQIDSAMNTVTNREKFAYDPLKLSSLGESIFQAG